MNKTKVRQILQRAAAIHRTLLIFALFGVTIGILLLTGAASPTSEAVTPSATDDLSPVTATTKPQTKGVNSPTSVKGTTPSTPTATNEGSGSTSPPNVSGPVAPSGSIGLKLFVDPSNGATAYAAANPGAAGAGLIARMGQQPVAAWFGGWSNSADISSYMGRAAAAGALPVLVAYNIPNRDCGGYSAGGAQTEAAYAAWIQMLAQVINGRQALVILEPDAIAQQTCLNTEQLAARNRELNGAIRTLAATGARVYLDAGHSAWLSATETANRLQAAGIANASGFALNVSNFGTTASNVSYGNQISSLVGGKHYVVDVSRNGRGQAPDGQWCNPADRALGGAPTTVTGTVLADAYLWIKTPWESDGSCNGHPAAGQNDWPYAISLAQAAGW